MLLSVRRLLAEDASGSQFPQNRRLHRTTLRVDLSLGSRRNAQRPSQEPTLRTRDQLHKWAVESKDEQSKAVI